MTIQDTGRTSSTRNMIPLGIDIGTARVGGGKIHIQFNGRETLYTTALQTLLGLDDLTAVSSSLLIPFSKLPKNPAVGVIKCTLVENTAGGDTIVDSSTVEFKCALDKIADAIAGLPGTALGDKTVQYAYVG